MNGPTDGETTSFVDTVVLTGRQACGKGTQAKKLLEWLPQAVVLGTGELLRKEVEAGTDIGRSIQAKMEAGQMVDTDVVVGLLRKAVAEVGAGTPIIFDGFPRSPEQADILLDILGETREAVVLVVDIPLKTAITRIKKRAQLEDRPDDSVPAAIQTRLQTYEAKTIPAIAALEQAGLRVIRVNGEQNVEGVAKDIYEQLAPLMGVTSSEQSES